MTTHLQPRAAAVDRLLARWDLEPGDVLAVQLYATDVVVSLRAPLSAIEWIATPRTDGVTYRHDLTHEDVPIRLLAWIPNEEAA